MAVNWGLGVPQGNALTSFQQGMEQGRQRRQENELMGFRREQFQAQREDREYQRQQRERERVAEAARTLRPVYEQMSQMPYEQRRAWLQQVAPRLVQRGIPEQVITGYDPTDQNLQADLALSRRATEPYTLGEGDVRYDENNRVIGRGGAPRPRYYSVPPGGRLVPEPGATGDGAPLPPAVGTVEDGYRFNGGDPADPNSWEPVSQGGAGPSGPRNFR